MEMEPVDSSYLKAVGYDPIERLMRIEFKGGATYDYPGTLPHEHQALMDAPSRGKHFHAHVRGRENTKVK